jgi:hypothetical protein
MNRKQILKRLQLLIGLLLMLQCASAFGAQSNVLAVGSQLPPFTLGAPNSPEEQTYLGLKSNQPFSLSSIGSKLVLIEFLEAL